MGLVFSLAAEDYLSLVGKTFRLAHFGSCSSKTINL